MLISVESSVSVTSFIGLGHAFDGHSQGHLDFLLSARSFIFMAFVF